jgi:hypothetical protein
LAAIASGIVAELDSSHFLYEGSMKKLFGLLLTAMMVCVLAIGCGEKKKAATPPADEPKKDAAK